MSYQVVYNERGERFLFPFLAGALITAPLWGRANQCCNNQYPNSYPYPYPYPMPTPAPYPVPTPTPYPVITPYQVPYSINYSNQTPNQTYPSYQYNPTDTNINIY